MEAKDFLPYYDVGEGLGRLRGNKMLLSRLISSYIAKLTLDDFDKAYYNGQIEDARAIIHTIKGATANLSMNGVYHLSREVEAIIKENGDITQMYSELKNCVEETKKITPTLIQFLK